MKKLTKTFALAITAVTVFIFCLTGCAENSKITVLDQMHEGKQGTHIVNVVSTDTDMINGGNSSYKIVIPKDASVIVRDAARLLQDILYLSTGVELEIIPDAGIVYSARRQYISIGDTLLIHFADIKVDKAALADSGFRIVTKDKSVFLAGGGDNGAYYAVTEFLQHTVGYGVYAKDEIVYDKKNVVKLLNFDVTEVPDFAYRIPYYLTLINNGEFARNLRTTREDEVLIAVDGYKYHNTFRYLSKTVHQSAHPKWYSEGTAAGKEQLCYLARGDGAELDLMIQAFMKKFVEVVKANPNLSDITITHEDFDSWCSCSACAAEHEKYGTNAAVMVKFCNRISEAFEVYKLANDYERDINIWFFAYLQTKEAPVKLVNGAYMPIDDGVLCRDNVFPYYAPLYADYSRSFYDKGNNTDAEVLKKWGALSKKLNVWMYSTCFSDYLSPFDNFSSMQETYIFFRNHNVSYLFDQAQWENDPAPDWGNLKIWLNAKLMWNVNANMDDLLNEFFTNYYKEAAPVMLELFKGHRAHLDYLRSTNDSFNSVYKTMATEKNYPLGILDTFLAAIDRAYASIEYLSDTDPGLYAKLYDRITLESVSYRYMDIQFYAFEYGEQERMEKRLAFKQDTMRLGISVIGEPGIPIDNIYQNWGV